MAKSSGKTGLDPTKDSVVREIRERREYAGREWADIRKEAGIDMRFVSGDPWDDDDKDVRGEDRPTIAPEEMSQYRNQVTNTLRANPRGMKFQPVGAGASKKTAEFYQDKGREIEYRSHAVEAYIGGAECVLQRSYGFWRVETVYQSPRSANQEIKITGFPDPDVVLMDPDIKRRTGEDQRFCFVEQLIERSEFKRKYPKAKVVNFNDYLGRPTFKDWVVGPKQLRIAEYWSISTTERKLWAVMLSVTDKTTGAVQMSPKPMMVFEDELELLRGQASRGVAIVAAKEIRKVDYPKVSQKITNGLEILEDNPWKGKYIPIVSLFGPILYVPSGAQTKKTILSMTRFGRDPWKAFCYASSQELEVLGMVPHGSVVAHKGQLDGFEDDWEEALHRPKLVLYYQGRVPGMTAEDERLPAPQRLAYTQGEYLQAIEMVKEGFRRSIQAAMGSNFLPTQAQKRNEKSGVALEKMDQAAAQGTYHFVDAYEDGIRHTGVILEDLIPYIYDYEGETGVMNGKGDALTVPINKADDPEAFSTRGDHLVTVSTAPSSDSAYDAAQQFLEALLSNLETIAGIAGPQAAAALLAQSIKMRNLGPMGDELADMILPPEMKDGEDGKPVDPRLMQAKQQIQQMGQKLQELGFVIKTKQVEGRAKFEIEKYKTDAKSESEAADREVKLAIAELTAKIERIWLFLEESRLVGARADEAASRRAAEDEAVRDRAHESIEASKDRVHAIHQGDRAALQGQIAAADGEEADHRAAARDATLQAAAAEQSAGHDAAADARQAALAQARPEKLEDGSQ